MFLALRLGAQVRNLVGIPMAHGVFNNFDTHFRVPNCAFLP